jgi:hypothetical protein
VCQTELQRRQKSAKDMKSSSGVSQVKELKLERGKRQTNKKKDGRRWV